MPAGTESARILAELFRTTTNRRELLKRAAALGLAAPIAAAVYLGLLEALGERDARQVWSLARERLGR